MAEPARIPISKPWTGEAEAEAARRVILSGWVTQGPEVSAFEREFAAYVGAPHACAVSNATEALRLALLVVGVGPGDEVITVSHSFIATANVVRACGASPVFIDIDPATFNLDPAKIEAAVSPRTRALLCVHQVGLPCDMPAVLDAVGGRFPVVEDAACAAGSELRWQGRFERVGRPHGLLACFSFHPRKILTTGEGGMITTRDPDLDRRLRRLRQHGMTVSDAVRHGSGDVVFESYDEVGSNARLSDIQAAVGREQLKRLPEVIARRRALAGRYATLLAGVPGLTLPAEPVGLRSNWQSYVVRLPDGVPQRAVMQSMLDAGVATRRGVMNAHREPAYRDQPWRCEHPRTAGACGRPCPAGSCQRLAESERAQDRCVMLPLFHQLTEAEQGRVADALRSACEECRADRPPAAPVRPTGSRATA